MKSYSTDLKSEFYRENYIAVDLVEIHLKNTIGANTPLYLCSGGFDLTWASTTSPTVNPVYTAQGEFMGFSPMGEEFEVKVGKFSIYLSGVGNSYVSTFVNGEFEGKRVVIWKAFLKFVTTGSIQTLTIVDTPILMFDGTIYNIAITESSRSCQLTIDCSSLFADFERTAGRKTNNGSNWLFQGSSYDTSMEKSGYVAATEIKWGKL